MLIKKNGIKFRLRLLKTCRIRFKKDCDSSEGKIWSKTMLITKCVGYP
jgi:hypothetical protein